MNVWLLDAIKKFSLKQTAILELGSQFLEFRQSLPDHFLTHTEWQTKPKGDKISIISHFKK
jgi:hypothetical protein